MSINIESFINCNSKRAGKVALIAIIYIDPVEVQMVREAYLKCGRAGPVTCSSLALRQRVERIQTWPDSNHSQKLEQICSCDRI